VSGLAIHEGSLLAKLFQLGNTVSAVDVEKRFGADLIKIAVAIGKFEHADPLLVKADVQEIIA
jgi:hypothetical protein